MHLNCVRDISQLRFDHVSDGHNQDVSGAQLRQILASAERCWILIGSTIIYGGFTVLGDTEN